MCKAVTSTSGGIEKAILGDGWHHVCGTYVVFMAQSIVEFAIVIESIICHQDLNFWIVDSCFGKMLCGEKTLGAIDRLVIWAIQECTQSAYAPVTTQQLGTPSIWEERTKNKQVHIDFAVVGKRTYEIEDKGRGEKRDCYLS